jgi:hypothetical protein
VRGSAGGPAVRCCASTLEVSGTDSAPREYRDSLRMARSAILAQSEALATAGIALDARLEGLDSALLGHTMLSFAEMLGRLAVNDPATYPRSRLESYATTVMKALGR